MKRRKKSTPAKKKLSRKSSANPQQGQPVKKIPTKQVISEYEPPEVNQQEVATINPNQVTRL